MSTNGHSLNGWRTDPMYSFSEAAHLANVSAGTVRNWLFGYSTGDRQGRPLFTPPPDQGPMVSFLQMIEIVVAARLRKAEHARFQKVYEAYRNAQRLYTFEFPFAHIELEHIGSHIVHLIHGDRPKRSLQSLDNLAQWTLPGLIEIKLVVGQLDYEHTLASRWWPIGKDVPIVVDPRISSGVPTIAGRGVTVEAILRRFEEAKLSIEFIAQDYELKSSHVEHAIRFGKQVAA